MTAYILRRLLLMVPVALLVSIIIFTLLRITPDSLRKLMEDFPFDPMTIVTLGPEGKTGSA